MATALSVAEPQQCQHQWDIAPPNGPTSAGYCPRCDTRREFANSIQDEKRSNNTDLFVGRRGGNRQIWSDDDADSALRSMYRR